MYEITRRYTEIPNGTYEILSHYNGFSYITYVILFKK